ncbi:MAG: RdgB/HAM1 family non-canonical purine NTP pyrophosphatase [Christensenellaceae bacterium]|jgi:XTP/dITP diphosphohydrolase|nr:RdgB/HAM1 family non-canonical purine NTP pyrophosphatase [Christensenellaceae bacterium]
METLVVATNNKHKLDEIRAILYGKFEIKSLDDVGIQIDIPETGSTFYENALIKADTICKLTGSATMADDSGLEVVALDGQPGVHSARYAGEPCNDQDNNSLLLKKMSSSVDRRAKFVSAIVACFPDGRIISATGETSGTIIDKPRGNGGFGYDPLFLSDEIGKTFGEASSIEKNKISHRARALQQFIYNLEQETCQK